MSIRETRKIADRVDGYLGRREGAYLYSLAKLTAGKGDVVEIGSFKGKSTIWLANGRKANPGEKIFAVDPHKYGTEQEFRQNIMAAGVDDVIIPIVKPSAEAVLTWSRSIGLLWIDGGHSYDEVRTDFISWEPFVSDGGVIALHDTYSWEGVRVLVDEEILTNDKFQFLGQWDSICAVKKVSHLSRMRRARRRAFVYLRALFNRGRSERRHWRSLPRKVLRGLSSPKPKD
jgi:hypothetical protein